MKDTCEILKLNPNRYYRWRRHFNNQGMEGLKNHNSTPDS
ncbi:helix-turn-helix domain-containing protein [Natroniella acetigena]